MTRRNRKTRTQPADITLRQLAAEIVPGLEFETKDGLTFTLVDEDDERTTVTLSELLQDLANMARDAGC